jgi:LPXTG-motif cell wall-anchored protein
MNRLIALLVLLIVAAFALPSMIAAFDAVIPALIGLVVLIGVGALLFQRRRRW